jgi:hypothetical protein
MILVAIVALPMVRATAAVQKSEIAAPVGSSASPIRLTAIYETVLALAIFHQLERDTIKAADIIWNMPRDVRTGVPAHQRNTQSS